MTDLTCCIGKREWVWCFSSGSRITYISTHHPAIANVYLVYASPRSPHLNSRAITGTNDEARQPLQVSSCRSTSQAQLVLGSSTVYLLKYLYHGSERRPAQWQVLVDTVHLGVRATSHHPNLSTPAHTLVAPPDHLRSDAKYLLLRLRHLLMFNTTEAHHHQ